MKKYLVDIYLPAAGRHMDVFLPAEKQIGEIIQLLASLAKSLYEECYTCTPDTMLFNADTGEAFDLFRTVEEAGIHNASQLILI